jgi:hypothetical protein
MGLGVMCAFAMALVWAAPAQEEIVVIGEVELRHARAALESALASEGYQLRRTRNGRDIFVSATDWRPKVVVDRDGWLLIRRRGLVITDPSGAVPIDGNALRYAGCVVQPTRCMSTRGLTMSRRRMLGERGRVFAAMEDSVRVWLDALGRHAHEQRITVQLPAELTQIWHRGIDLDGTALASPVAREEALHRLWASRAHTPWGDEAAGVIERFVQTHLPHAGPRFVRAPATPFPEVVAQRAATETEAEADGQAPPSFFDLLEAPAYRYGVRIASDIELQWTMPLEAAIDPRLLAPPTFRLDGPRHE